MQPATAQVFFGEDINSTATENKKNALRIKHPNADAARKSFLSLLQNVTTETFESFAPYSKPTTLTFGLDTATLTPAITVRNITAETFLGVYPISGNQILLQSFFDNNRFRLDFSSPQAAFGFYVTDVEIVGNLSLQFLLADGVSTINRQVPTQAGTNGKNNTGSVAYYGVIDTANPFISVTFRRNLNSADAFGFDDITIVRVANVISEPKKVFEPSALSGLAVVSLGKLLKKRRDNGG